MNSYRLIIVSFFILSFILTTPSLSYYVDRHFYSDNTIIVLSRNKERLILTTHLSFSLLDSISQNINNRITLNTLTREGNDKHVEATYVT